MIRDILLTPGCCKDYHARENIVFKKVSPKEISGYSKRFLDFAEIPPKISRDFGISSMCAEISERFRGISRHVYEISVSDGPLGCAQATKSKGVARMAIQQNERNKKLPSAVV